MAGKRPTQRSAPDLLRADRQLVQGKPNVRGPWSKLTMAMGQNLCVSLV